MSIVTATERVQMAQRNLLRVKGLVAMVPFALLASLSVMAAPAQGQTHGPGSTRQAQQTQQAATPQQAQAEEVGFALAHAAEVMTILQQCGLDRSLVQRADHLVRDYAARLQPADRSRAIDQGARTAGAMLGGGSPHTKRFFCAEAQRMGGEWVSNLEAMRQNF